MILFKRISRKFKDESKDCRNSIETIMSSIGVPRTTSIRIVIRAQPELLQQWIDSSSNFEIDHTLAEHLEPYYRIVKNSVQSIRNGMGYLSESILEKGFKVKPIFWVKARFAYPTEDREILKQRIKSERTALNNFIKTNPKKCFEKMIRFLTISDSFMDISNQKTSELTPLAIQTFKKLFESHKSINSDADVKKFFENLDKFNHLYDIFDLPLLSQYVNLDFDAKILTSKKDDIAKITDTDDFTKKLNTIVDELNAAQEKVERFLASSKSYPLDDIVNISDDVRSLLNEMRFTIDCAEDSEVQRLNTLKLIIKRFNGKYAEVQKILKDEEPTDKAIGTLKRVLKEVHDAQKNFNQEIKTAFKLA